MGLFASINRHLTDELLTQLAEASALPMAVARAAATAAVPVLVQHLAQPVDYDELNARWDMCRQLYLSQLLTQPEELLRTDLGWPDRRRYLTQKLLGTADVAALTEPTGQPVQANTLLGYLTVVALATVGEQADKAALAPADMGSWLAKQPVPEQLALAALAVLPVGQVSRPAAATAGTAKLTLASVLGSVAVASLVGGYFWLSGPVEAKKPTAPTVSAVVSAAPLPTATPLAEPAAPAPEPAVPVVAAVAAGAEATRQPAATHTKPTALPVVAAAVLRDTVGNAALARQVGGKFNPAAGRYLKGEAQPLIIKLINRATLTVGINSTESLLYKRLEHPNLPRPADIAVDRLSFDLGQARLGAEGAQQLGNVANLLKTFPKARLIVVGHANNHEAQAMLLGLKRATLAVDELVKQGIAADRLQAQGMLATELPGDSDSAEKQAMLQGISLKMSRL